MGHEDQSEALKKAKTLAVLMKVAPYGTPVDFKSNHDELFNSGVTEELLHELGQEGAILYEAAGDSDNLLICYTKESETPQHLQRYFSQAIEQLENDKRSLQNDLSKTKLELSNIYRHNPQGLKNKIESSKENMRNLQQKIAQDKLLSSLSEPLNEIQSHFESIATVAENYASVYSNILKPVEDEGKKGVLATALWAIFGIIVSVAVANLDPLRCALGGSAG